VAIAETSSTSAGARPHVKRPRGQSLDGALDAVDAAAQGVELTIRLQTLASGQIIAQSANLLVLVTLVNASIGSSYLITELVKKRSDRFNENLSPGGLSTHLRHW
jgi:hypothetical protein